MPIPVTSRYRGLTPINVLGRDGLPHPSVPARIPPAIPRSTTEVTHIVIAGDTMEALAARYLGSSEVWWQLADANPAVFPTELLPGTLLVIPISAAPGLVERTRRF